MVKIQQTVSDFKEPEKGQTYQILEAMETVQQNFKGLKIKLEPTKRDAEDKADYSVTAWFGQKGFVGSKSKLGAFITAFSDFYAKDDDIDTAIAKAQDSDTWIGHTVKILEWHEKNNQLKVIS